MDISGSISVPLLQSSQSSRMPIANDEASNILGWLSIGCWIIVYSPQIIENYQLKSGEGLSVLFVVVWLLGDLLNLFGALMASLLPTVIFLGAYYSICDIILLFQIYYYRWSASSTDDSTSEDDVHPTSGTSSESTPLLTQDNTKSSPVHKRYAKAIAYSLAVIFVISFGIISWLVGRRNRHDGVGPGSKPKEEDVIEWKSQTLGWGSAILYLGSRLPQILKNRKTQCAGLSLALFLFAVAGNLTYVASILVKSLSRKHLIANASWLVGSGGTVALDMVVLGQFIYYQRKMEMDAS